MNTEFNSWTFWFYKKENDKMWNECIHEVATCKSIDEFWTLIKSIRRPSHLDAGSDYAFFRNSIPPYWEDERNENGGRWKIIIDRFIPYAEVNKLWMDILLILMNEKLMWNSSICGVVFSSRSRHIKIGIECTKNVNNCTVIKFQNEFVFIFF